MTSPLPLSGILVADFTRVLAGPLCTQMLSDFGARVVKIERPGSGDETRRWGPPFVNGVSTYFLAVNRGKESVAVDLRSPAGQKVVRELIRRADVVVDNFLPSQRSALRLTSRHVRALNRRVIHCSITGYDRKSSEADQPGYDLLAQAESGLMSITGDPGGDPMKVGVALADVLTAHHACGAITAALVGRAASGKGATLEISLFGSSIASLVNVSQAALATGKNAGRYGNAHASIVPYALFHASDRPLVIGVGTDRHFTQLCRSVLCLDEMASDARFTTNRARVEHRTELVGIIATVVATKPARVWTDRCRKAGVPAAIVRSVSEAMTSDEARDMTVDLQHPIAGPYRALLHPARLDGKRLRRTSPPPTLGQHTAAVLRELGFDDD